MKKFKFTIQGNDYEVDIKNFEGNIAELEVNGTPYQVEVHKEIKEKSTPTIVRTKLEKPTETKPLASSASLTKVIAPLPGSIIEVFVNVGDTVNVGDKLLIMEAMKMENNVLAEKSGVVKNLKIKAGQVVLQGDVLIEIA